ncbi:hypothetical protein CC2G_008377 [Coprinopsis cinerea AmutBmut pab1-1]|nr:hypothetical protein CC2G_008377 [Coprinopsis cinerea AmutBmut pab1-1]
MSTGSSFLSLPPELHIKILNYSDSEDIVATRQTCKHLYDVEKTFHEQIWKACLTQINLRVPLFLPTFQAPVSSQCLESIARRTTRSLEPVFNMQHNHSLSPHDLQPVPSFERRILHNHLANVHPLALYLTPGGRFLLVLTILWLQVWDLAPFLESHEPPIFIKKFPVPPSSKSTLMTAGGGDTKAIQIVLKLQRIKYPTNPPTIELRERFQHPLDQHDQWLSIFVAYELSFSGTEPQLTKLGDLGFIRDEGSRPDRDHLKILTESRALFFVDGVMVVWDFRNHAYCAWKVSEGEYDPLDITIFASQGNAFYRHQDKLVAFEIPPLNPIQEPSRRPEILQLSSVPPSPCPSHLIRLPIKHQTPDSDLSLRAFDWMPHWGFKESNDIVFLIHEQDRTIHITTWYGLQDTRNPRNSILKPLGRERVDYPGEYICMKTVAREAYGSREVLASLYLHPALGEAHSTDSSIFACLSSRHDITQEAHSPLQTRQSYPVRLLAIPPEASFFDFDPLSGILVAAAFNSFRIFDIARPSLPC